jgi:hypothetical protein
VGLLAVTTAWGVWCWLLVTEYVIDYSGEEWNVGLFTVLPAVALLAGLSFATLSTWGSVPRNAGPRR